MIILDPHPSQIDWFHFAGSSVTRGRIPPPGSDGWDFSPLAGLKFDTAACVLPYDFGLCNAPAEPLTQSLRSKLQSSLPARGPASLPVLACLAWLESLPRAGDKMVLSNTAFFAEMPARARTYALPNELAEVSIRRGANGLYHAAAVRALEDRLPRSSRIISVWLGDEPDAAAIMDSRGIESTWGVTSSEGVLTASSCGSLDPSIPLLLAARGKPLPVVEGLLTLHSGWNALLGRPETLEELLRDQGPQAALCRQILASQLIKAIGASLAALEGVDAILFGCEDLAACLPFITELASQAKFILPGLLSYPQIRRGWAELTAPAAIPAVLAWQADRGLVLRQTCQAAGLA